MRIFSIAFYEDLDWEVGVGETDKFQTLPSFTLRIKWPENINIIEKMKNAIIYYI